MHLAPAGLLHYGHVIILVWDASTSRKYIDVRWKWVWCHRLLRNRSRIPKNQIPDPHLYIFVGTASPCNPVRLFIFLLEQTVRVILFVCSIEQAFSSIVQGAQVSRRLTYVCFVSSAQQHARQRPQAPTSGAVCAQLDAAWRSQKAARHSLHSGQVGRQVSLPCVAQICSSTFLIAALWFEQCKRGVNWSSSLGHTFLCAVF